MKFTLFGLTALLLPCIALAAFNDVQLTTGSTLVVTLGGSNYEFTVASGNVQDLNVDAASINFTLAAGSEIHINSADRKNFNYSNSQAGVSASLDCTATYSQLNVSLNSGADQAYSVTPTEGTCTVTGTFVGGGGSSEPAPTTTTSTTAAATTTTATSTPTTTVTATTTAVAATPVVAPEVIIPPAPVTVSAVFTADLARGNTGADVSRLQQILSNDLALYPERSVTGFFGPATQRAVVRFQEKYGLPAIGKVGPMTRQKLSEVFGGGQSSSGLNQDQRTMLQNKILELQKLLVDLLAQLQVALQAKVKP